MDDIIKKSWSCYDLHNSLFLSHNEIRTCCKRFFKNNQRKGDVVLINKDFNIDTILKSKQDLYTQINRGFSQECTGCPFLEFKNWGRIDKLQIEYLSFEYHSICNMKCSYCSEQYYGGEKAKYDIKQLVNNLINNKSLNQCKTIVWGGGEPTLEKNFKYLLNKTVEYFPKIKQRIITNSLVYNDLVQSYLDKNQITITTSIDAGYEDTFYQIRHNNNFDQVFINLQRYSNKNPHNITIKYIILDENNSIKEIKEFVNRIKKYNLQNCNFQISFNFKKDTVGINSIVSIVILYGLLEQIDVYLIFLDDLLLQRLKNISQSSYLNVVKKLKKLNYNYLLINKFTNKEIVIWGAGNQTKQLLESSIALKDIKIIYIVDNDINKIGSTYFGYKVYDPKELKNNNYPIYISAVQNTPMILEQYELLGLNKNRLLKGLIL